MLRSSFQRAAMAILLVGMMIAPLGICLQQSPKGAHSCCPQQGSAHSVHADCCVVRMQLPAILVSPKLPNPSPRHLAVEIMARVELTASAEHPAVVVIPPLSPPTGAFILRL